MSSAARSPLTLNRPVLREQLRQVVLARILDGTYAPGDRVVESRLMAEFGVSQAPVREALRELEAMHFLDSRPHRGARVRAVSHEEVGETYLVRSALEQLAARLGAGRVNDLTVAAAARELEGMREAAAAGDPHRQMAHDARFHAIIVEASGNVVLLETWQTLRVEARSTVTMLRAGIEPQAMAESHVPILEALRSGDGELTATRIAEHFDYYRNLVIRAHATRHHVEVS